MVFVKVDTNSKSLCIYLKIFAKQLDECSDELWIRIRKRYSVIMIFCSFAQIQESANQPFHVPLDGLTFDCLNSLFEI